MRSRIGPWVLALSAVTACEGIEPPIRGPGYSFDDFTGLTFHWPAYRLPVRFWVSPESGDVAQYVQTAIGVWRDQLLFGEFDGRLVPDAAGADVWIAVTPSAPPEAPLSDAPPQIQACEGVTAFDTTSTPVDGGVGRLRIAAPLQITVAWDGRFSEADIVNCLYRVTVHEIGHALGIFSHSLDSLDIMNGVPRVRDPSTRDRETLLRVYHTPADLEPPFLEVPRP